ncbi:MAG TPA: hypothetical protein VKT20_11115 [Candidatus Dormibacteraeota bacterium]|nr:hypothetical protein [Candidatus Dormibacteraeota bacterium]
MQLLAGRVAKKVPELTVYFWIVKVLTTGMGEATSDYFVHSYDPYLVVVLAAAALGLVLVIQLALTRYNPWIYWLAVSMVAVFGTMAAGIVHVYLGVPYIYSSALYAGSVVVIFVLWFISERTLSVHSIYSRRRETFYWAAVLATFAMGTAVGDMTAVSFHLGFFGSGILFAVLIAIPGVAYRFGLNEIIAFWFAYIITRPLGASFADWLAVPTNQGGLNLGKGPVSIALWILIIAFVAFLAITRRDTPKSVAGEEGQDRL